MSDNGSEDPRWVTRQVTRQEDMEAFDSLPTILRRAIANGALKWSSVRCLEALRAGYSVSGVLSGIRAADARVIGL